MAAQLHALYNSAADKQLHRHNLLVHPEDWEPKLLHIFLSLVIQCQHKGILHTSSLNLLKTTLF